MVVDVGAAPPELWDHRDCGGAIDPCEGQTPVRAIALSISSIPVAAPAPGHDPRRHLMTGSSRAHEKTLRGCLTRALAGREVCHIMI